VPTDPHFERLPEAPTEAVRIVFEGETLTAMRGDTVAAAVLAAGHLQTRTTPVSGAPRGPFCMMGMCFECLLEIDGQPNRQGCMVEVREGMSVRRMEGARVP
jgi:predicted molibdopterin-dependent oxidoreductase YjgC